MPMSSPDDRIWDRFEEKRLPIGGNIGEEYLTDEIYSESVDFERLEENARLFEMSIMTISWPEDGLEFDVCLKNPETVHKNSPHAHLLKPGRGAHDLNMRLKLFPWIPKEVADIQDAFPGDKRYTPIPDDWKWDILEWAGERNKAIPEISNWRKLWGDWLDSLRKG